MILYLIAHYKTYIVLILLFLFVTRMEFKSNRIRLILLYLILIKSILPWGVVNVVNLFGTKFQRIEGGFSLDLSPDVAMTDFTKIQSSLNIEYLILSIWLISFLLCFSLLLVSYFKLGIKVKKSRYCNDASINELISGFKRETGLKRSLQVKISSVIQTPLVWWNRKMFIIIPESVLSLNSEEKKVILAHEFTHIRRHDFIKFLVLKLIKTMFIFSPLVWFVINEIHIREEIQTDHEAMKNFRIKPIDFGQTILKFLSISNNTRYHVPTLLKPTKRNLKMRLEGLFKSKMNRKATGKQFVVVFMMFGIFTLNFSSTAVGKASVKGNFLKPLTYSRISVGFGPFMHPFSKKMVHHSGIDLVAKIGTKIVSPAKARVLSVDYNKKQGHFLILQHSDGYQTLYSHLHEINVLKGGFVKQGEIIAAVGNSGLSTGPHLHLEVHKNNKAIDPKKLFYFE